MEITYNSALLIWCKRSDGIVESQVIGLDEMMQRAQVLTYTGCTKSHAMCSS